VKRGPSKRKARSRRDKSGHEKRQVQHPFVWKKKVPGGPWKIEQRDRFAGKKLKTDRSLRKKGEVRGSNHLASSKRKGKKRLCGRMGGGVVPLRKHGGEAKGSGGERRTKKKETYILSSNNNEISLGKRCLVGVIGRPKLFVKEIKPSQRGKGGGGELTGSNSPRPLVRTTLGAGAGNC